MNVPRHCEDFQIHRRYCAAFLVGNEGVTGEALRFRTSARSQGAQASQHN